MPAARIPLDPDALSPANDLFHNGEWIGKDGKDGVVQRRLEGVKIDEINPVPNDLWAPEPLPIEDISHLSFPAETSTLEFVRLTDASGGLYRALVTDGKNYYYLNIDLNNHRSLSTVAL